MLIQYTAIVIICMLVIPTAISELLDRQFRRFASDKLAEDQQDIVFLMQEVYARGNDWDQALLSGMQGNILRWPMLRVELYDAGGILIHEFRHNNKRAALPGGINSRRDSRQIEEAMNFIRTDKLIKMDEPVIVKGHKVGMLRFMCLPFNDSREGFFLKKFNRHMYYAIGLMLIISVLISFIMANRISRPVLNVSKRASLISGGNYRITDEMSSDITELQILIDSINKLGLELEIQENLRKRLMSDVAHELRNPLTIIKSHLEAFEDGIWEPTHERIKLTVDEIDRLSMLISEIEKLTSIEKTGKNLSVENADLSAEVEKTALSFDPLYSSKSVKLLRNIEPGIVTAVDMPKIRQAVENLLSNALRYTDEGGNVLLRVQKMENNIEISVKDSGIGISEKDMPYIFERFYRADKSRTRASGGMGIGLAITKAIVEAHSGNISVKSAEGSGSDFKITIPVRLVA
jgi:signal transduction histidine kinase